MAKVEMNEVYVNRKNPERKATVCKVDDKAKTAILREESGKAIGPMSFPTLSKSWKKVEEQLEPLVDLDNPITEQEAQEKGMITGDKALEQAVVESENISSDGTPYTEVMKEIQKDGKKAAKEAKKATVKKKEQSVSANYDECLNKVQAVVESLGYGIRVSSSSPRSVSVVKKDTGKQVYGIYLGAKKFTVNMSKSKVPEGMTPDKMRNCPLAAVFDVSYDNTNKIKELIKEEN